MALKTDTTAWKMDFTLILWAQMCPSAWAQLKSCINTHEKTRTRMFTAPALIKVKLWPEKKPSCPSALEWVNLYFQMQWHTTPEMNRWQLCVTTHVILTNSKKEPDTENTWCVARFYNFLKAKTHLCPVNFEFTSLRVCGERGREGRVCEGGLLVYETVCVLTSVVLTWMGPLVTNG